MEDVPRKTMIEIAQPSVLAVDYLPIPHRAGMHDACLLSFDPSTFDPCDFKRIGIARPPSVASSVHRRQAEFFYGRLAARYALCRLGVDPADIPIGASREPLWPDGLIGSISHCNGWATAVVERLSTRGGIGIDIERVVGTASVAAILDVAIDEHERALVRAVGLQLPLPVVATIVFSAKESLFKAAFSSVRRIFDYTAARMVALRPNTGQLRLSLTENLSSDFPRGHECVIHFRLVRPDVVLTSYAW